MIKDELRAKMKEKRRAMTLGEVKEKSAKIRNALFSFDKFTAASTVCTFISAFKEPDTMEIIRALWRESKKVIVPITHMETNTLSLSYIESDADLQKGAYGILEPATEKTADISHIDALLIPGLAFDKKGGRMGFGKGYYDRLLEKTHAVKIALCYEFQILSSVPTEKHDIPMDFIVTEDRIYAV